MRESFGIKDIRGEEEGRLIAQFTEGSLETQGDGDGYEMALHEGDRKETFFLQGADEEEAKRLHEFAADFIRDNPGTFADPGYLWHAIEKERKKGGVH